MQLMTRRLTVTVVVFSLISLYVCGQTFPFRASHVAPTLDRAPYLQNVTPTSAIIAWRTQHASEAFVLYRETGGEWTHVVARKGPAGHYAALARLKPDTRYVYKVLVDGHVVGRGTSFKTAKARRIPASPLSCSATAEAVRRLNGPWPASWSG